MVEAKKPAANTADSSATAALKKKGKSTPKVKIVRIKFCVDCTVPAKDGVLDPNDLVKFLEERIKVNNKLSNLKDKVALSSENKKVFVNAEMPFSKRYIKYLTRKYLKKQQLRDYLRVIASKGNSYELRYYEDLDSQ